MKRNELSKAFAPIPDDCYRALMSAAYNAREETVVKKKLSVALVFAIVLVLAAGVALAVVMSLRDTGRQVVQNEQVDGYYSEWPVEKKVSLVNALVELGHTERTTDIEKLLTGALAQDETIRVADEVMVAFTGVEVSEISFMEIMQAAWGSFEKWTHEEQAWYSQLMVDMNLQGEDHTLYVEPTGPVDEAGAIAVAKREIARVFGVDESALDAYDVTTSFQVPERPDPAPNAKQAYWSIDFWVPDDMPKEDRLFPISFWAYIHPETGALREPLEELADAMKYQIANADVIELRNQVASSFDENMYLEDKGTIEDMMAFKQKWTPLLDQIIAGGQAEESELSHTNFLKAMARFIPAIAMPTDHAIHVDMAIINARKAIMGDRNWSEETMDYFVPSMQIYLSSEGEKAPIYLLVFTTRKMTEKEMNDSDAEKAFAKYREAYMAFFGEWDHVPRYISIGIDALTGDVAREPVIALSGEYADYERLLAR